MCSVICTRCVPRAQVSTAAAGTSAASHCSQPPVSDWIHRRRGARAVSRAGGRQARSASVRASSASGGSAWSGAVRSSTDAASPAASAARR